MGEVLNTGTLSDGSNYLETPVSGDLTGVIDGTLQYDTGITF
jgi:hypothetical protein